MSHLNKTLISLMLLLTFSCSLNVDKSPKETGEVNISIPNISPNLLNALRGTDSRAYNFIDKLIITASKNGSEDIKVEKNFIINKDNTIVLILESGDYTIKANIFNLNNSETEAVVSGEGTVTISPDTEANLNIVLMPNNPELFTENSEITLNINKHTEYIQYIGMVHVDTEWITNDWGETYPSYIYEEQLVDAVLSIGEEHWYEVVASTNATDFKITNAIENFSPAILTVYNKDGKKLKSTTLMDQKISIRTTPEVKYYVSIVPINVKSEYGDFYEDQVTFICSPNTDEDKDGNTSKDTAVTIKGDYIYIGGNFDSFNDVDYYKIDLIKGQSLNKEFMENLKAEIIDSSGIINLPNSYTVTEDGSVFIRVSNITNDKNSDHQMLIAKETPVELITQFVSIPGNWRPNFNPESLLTKTVNSETGEVTVNYDMSSENNIQFPHAELFCEFYNFSLNGVGNIVIEYKSDKDIRFSLVDGAKDFSAYGKVLPASETYTSIVISYIDFSKDWGEDRDLNYGNVEAIRFDGIDRLTPGEFTIKSITFE